jgi:hypothetical protein
MSARRQFHTATRLADGRVLIAGGANEDAYLTFLATAEIFDPATGDFTPTGSMKDARENHTATLLPDGRVLVAGGDRPGRGVVQPYLAGAEIYDPATGEWTATGSLLTARASATATLLGDGRVLVAGGSGFVAAAVSETATALAAAELFDPKTGQFTSASSMTQARAGHTATLLAGGRVLLVAGSSDQRSAELYEPASGRFVATGSTGVPVFDHTATLLADGRVLIAGGVQAGDPRVCEVYWP